MLVMGEEVRDVRDLRVVFRSKLLEVVGAFMANSGRFGMNLDQAAELFAEDLAQVTDLWRDAICRKKAEGDRLKGKAP